MVLCIRFSLLWFKVLKAWLLNVFNSLYLLKNIWNIKGIVNLKRKMLLFAHPHLIPDMYNFILWNILDSVLIEDDLCNASVDPVYKTGLNDSLMNWANLNS